MEPELTATRLAAAGRFLQRADPTSSGLQETKAAQLSDEAEKMFERHGHQATHVGTGSYNGVAVAARHPIDDIRSSVDLDEL